MSEPKRVPLQTLEFPESLGHATKKEKKGEKGKQLAPSFRFTLVLPESNEKACPEFNYSQLLKAAEKKRRKEQKRTDENATNGLDPFDDDDDDDDEDKLREMAKRFEAKYGTATAGRKRHNKYDDYVDLGAGYDENDSFIDNTDAYDEIVPEEMTTAHGGFYINCGALEFKAAEGNSLVHNNNNINNNNNNNTININNEDESSESSEDDAEEAESPKRTEKRPFSTSEDDDTEDMIGDQPRKKLKLDENMEKKLNHEALIKKKKKQHQHHSQQQQQSLQPQQQSQQQQQQQQQLQQQLQQQELDALNRRKIPVVRDLLKEKRETLETEGGAEELDERKRLEKLELQKSKPTMEKKFDIKKFEKKSSSNGLDARKLDLKRLGGKDSNIDDAIESVVNAARVEDESSRETMDSGKSRGIIGSESECDDVDKEEAPLPDSLAEDVKEIVNKLKMHAENSKEGKTKFFNASVNSGLFSLEKKLRSLYTPSVRMQTYDHLAHFLPCSKITLVNRAKKLFLQDVEYRVKEPLQRLKIVIDSVMPSIMERYTKECQRVADEKGIEGSPTDAESSDGDDSSNKNSDKTRIPRRRFPWNDESKKLIYEIACARRQYFEVLRPRKESMESFVAAFMDTKVRPLWPPGWVRLQTLLKYSNLEPTVKRKAKKPKDLASSTANTIVSSGTTISNSTARIDIPNANTVITTTTTAATTTTTTTCSEQERIRTPTSFSKITSVSTENNPINFTVTTKTSELNAERKQGCKYKDKNRESPMTNQHDNPIPVGVSTNSTLAKISVVPASQLMPQKARSHVEKFNPMDLTSSSLSITPVNDYQKSGKPSETKKDVVSITPYSETMANVPNVTDGNAMVSQSGHHHSVSRQEVSYSTGQMQQQQQQQQQSSSSYSLPNQSGSISSLSKPVPLKHRILQESIETKSERRTENKDSEVQHKTEKREKRRERCADGKHKSHDSKKRRKDHKVDAIAVNAEILPIVQQPLLTKEEQEQRQIEETMAATNFLSQIINDDAPRTVVTDKRKETAVVDDIAGNTLLPTEQENDVQMVMRSLKELQELQEMKYSPSHSPVGSIQKPSKSNVQYVSYQEDYQRLYHKKDDKLRLSKKDDPQW